MLEYQLYKIATALALAVPLKIGYKTASIISDIKYLFSRTERRELLENLKVVFPDRDIKVLKTHIRKIFKNFSLYLVDFFRLEKLSFEYISRHVQLVNLFHVDEALDRGKGVIILSAHIGNWEFGGVGMGMAGYPLSVVALEHKDKRVNEFFVKQRQDKGVKVIPISIALRRCFGVLKNNEILAILGDKDFTSHGFTGKFFGRDTVLPKGPGLFSLKTGAAIVPGFVLRTHDDYFKLVFEKPIYGTPTGDIDKDIETLTAEYIKIVESYIRMHPTQWYCFRRFWKTHNEDMRNYSGL